ncbi:carboxymuconolactone decarboxylase family protein [Actinomyces oris]|uniref:carboxymuconolactone decarboxylase family protein n=1 Tax=Actinomyces TaxID=1654 RepID=UPI0008070CB5|nr:carboxymuconolactone decarboxylase family protein [Actinomyces oris]OBY94036.1 hypothetical protein BBG13_03405 [Actinomyces oris]
MALTLQARETFTRLFGVEPQPHPTDPELFDILQNGIFDEAFSTGVLTDVERELISLVAIAAIGATTQLRPHVAGAIRAGSSRQKVAAALVQVMPYIGGPYALPGLVLVARYDESASAEVYR